MTEEEKTALHLRLLKATAVRTAVNEVIAESREEIIKRAKAKLTAMGVDTSGIELGGENGANIP